jgi:hypothetical protein
MAQTEHFSLDAAAFLVSAAAAGAAPTEPFDVLSLLVTDVLAINLITLRHRVLNYAQQHGEWVLASL